MLIKKKYFQNLLNLCTKRRACVWENLPFLTIAINFVFSVYNKSNGKTTQINAYPWCTREKKKCLIIKEQIQN